MTISVLAAVVQSDPAGPPPGQVYNLVLSTNSFNVNIRDEFDAQFPAPTALDTVNVTLAPNLLLGGNPSLRTGLWPSGLSLNIVSNTGTSDSVGLVGAGGQGGNAQSGQTGDDGGVGFLAEFPCTFDNLNGRIAGGGGGGGGTDSWLANQGGGVFYYAAGGGGAGNPIGQPGTGGAEPAGSVQQFPQTGSLTQGGSGGKFAPQDTNRPGEIGLGAGNGGDLATAGTDAGDVSQPGSEDNVGGAAGPAVGGAANVVFINQGLIIGAIVP